MQRALYYIASLGFMAGVGSMLYFLCLAVGVGHLAFAVPLVLGGCAGVFVLTGKLITPIESGGKTGVGALIVLAAGLALLLYGTVPHIQKYGGWDAWATWNFHALFLRNRDYWTMMFNNGSRAHPDYPLFIPSFIAFGSRLLHSRVEPVSYALHLAITLAIPSLIFLRYHSRNLLLASAALFLLATDTHYIQQGISMYADTALPFFILCAMLSLDAPGEKGWRSFFATLAIGCCMWTKNEGVMMAAVFTLVYASEIFAGGTIKFAVAGLALPILTLCIFKFGYAPANDMVSGVSQNAISQLTDADRYRLIFASFAENIRLHFQLVAIFVPITAALCIFARRRPHKSIAFVAIMLVGYVITYTLTYLDLEWHLHTSFDRLLHQVMPIAVYGVAGTLTYLPWPGRMQPSNER